MENPTPPIRNFIERMNMTLPENVWTDFLSIWEVLEAKRKTILSHPGEIEKHLYFVTEGVQRVYYFDEQQREATLVLTYPFSFAGVLDSFLMQSPSRYYFETLSSSQLLKTNHKKFMEVVERHPELDSLIKTMTYQVISGLLERMAELQCFSSEEKFRILLKRSPQVLQLVPHKYLANYLGIDATNFSKLINSVKI